MEEGSIGLREGFWSCNTAYVYLVVNSTEINRMYFWVNMHKITLKLISFSSSFKKQNHSLTTLVLWTTLNPHHCTIKKWDLHPAWANSQLVPFLPMVFNQQTHLTWQACSSKGGGTRTGIFNCSVYSWSYSVLTLKIEMGGKGTFKETCAGADTWHMWFVLPILHHGLMSKLRL